MRGSDGQPRPTARERLTALFPTLGPWTAAALWHGRIHPHDPPAAPLAAELDTICSQRLSGLLLRYIRDTRAEVSLDERRVLRQETFAWTEASLRAVTSARDVVARLRRAGIPTVVSKGPGIARYYPSTECRPYSDIDLLVEPDRFARAVEVLETLGWTEEEFNLQPWRFFRRHCREGLNLVSDGGGRVDLHHRLPPWLWGTRLDPRVLLAHHDTVEVGGGTLDCLDAADNLLVAALHLVSDQNLPGRTLLVWRDLVELAHAADVDTVVTRAHAAGLGGWLAAVLDALPAPLGTRPLRVALPDHAPIPHDRRLAALLSPDSARRGVVAAQVLRLPPLNGLAYAAGMLVPSHTFVHRKMPERRHPYLAWWWRHPEVVVDRRNVGP